MQRLFSLVVTKVGLVPSRGHDLRPARAAGGKAKDAKRAEAKAKKEAKSGVGGGLTTKK
jgi:hypothetical protein